MRLACALLPTLALACGSVDDTDTPQTMALVTLHGEVDANVTGIRAAIVWWWVTPYSGRPIDKHVQNLPLYQAFGSSRFEMKVMDLPPVAALVPHVEGMVWARGELVLYEDRNQNGTLDLIDPDTTNDYVDRIVAARRDLLVIYVEGEIPGPPWKMLNDSTDGTRPSKGYNLVFEQGCSFGWGPQGSCRERRVSYPRLDSAIAFPISEPVHPLTTEIMCLPKTIRPSAPDLRPTVHPIGAMPSSFPVATDTFVACGDERHYTQYTCTSPPRACAFTRVGMTAEWCSADTYRLAPNAPIPEGWPCHQLP